MRHRRPQRYRGQHRAAVLTPGTRYGVVVGTALVGAGVVAVIGGTTLPQPSATAAAAALEMPQSSAHSADRGEGATAQETPAPALPARAEPREAAPTPEKLPVWVRPAEGYISSGYGYRPEFHGGTDFAAPYGSDVHAASDGVVIIANWYGGYGMLVAIDHGNGVLTYYGHNSEILVSVGQTVAAGDVVSHVGSTGQSTGPHCHFEVRLGSERIDPLPYLRDRGVDV